ncbi:winged helix-turn-helix transcriptional regulator [Methanospirillum lacunae]
MKLMENTATFKYSWGIDAALDVIGGKWKPLVLYQLKEGTMRFSQIMERVKPKISQRMLTRELRELEKDGLITRKVYAVIPPKVEYTLTEKGDSLMPILDQLCDWGYEHMNEDIEFKCEE